MSESKEGDSTIKPDPEGGTTTAAGPAVDKSRAPPSNVSSTSSLQFVPKVAVVTTRRKEELLLKARAERRHWIEKVPLPYSPEAYQHDRRISGTTTTNNNTYASIGNDLWAVSNIGASSNDCLYKVKSSVICQDYLPTATNVISELYGLPTITAAAAARSNSTAATTIRVDPSEGPLGLMQVAERVEALVNPYMGVEGTTDPSLQEVTEETGGDDETTPADDTHPPSIDSITSDPKVLQAYQSLWTSLLWPESSVLVQGMKNFLFHWKQNHFHHDDKPPSLPSAAKALNSYCKSTVESILQSNRALVGTNEESCNLRRSLESFMYGHARDILKAAVDNDLSATKQQSTKEEEDETFSKMTPGQLEDRLLELQFVQPSHLEIACMQDATFDSDDDKLQELLREPIRALLSMDAYHSPYEKLEQILLVYKGVNAALSTALNENKREGAPSVLPSADDVLPTVILVCIKARPRHLLHNLQFIEQFAAPEYLRGEAGYAYTNLYGAVQFLQDLDLKHTIEGEEGHGDAVSSNQLSISTEDLKKGLEKCRKQRDEMMASQKGVSSASATSSNSNPLVDGTGLPQALPSIKLSVQEVHTAQMHGETVDLEWAKQRQHHQPQEAPTTGAIYHAKLPEGFKRSYSFLNAQPQDIRVADLQHLLDEYHMLVHVTEELLSERKARIAAERKQRELEQQQALGEQLLLGGSGDS